MCCLLVLNLVSSTLSCIRQPRPRLLKSWRDGNNKLLKSWQYGNNKLLKSWKQSKYRTPHYFWQWQLINYWDDCHLEPIPRPSSATEMNFQSVFECENAWSWCAGARNRIRKERFSATKLLSLDSLRDCLSVRGRVFKGISDTQQILVEIGCFLLVHRSA